MAGREKTSTRWFRRLGFRLTKRRFLAIFFATTICASLSAGLSACWLPNEFLTEIRLSTDRSYALIYEGELLWAPLARDIRDSQKNLTPQEIAEKIEVLTRDLQRDSNFKSVRSLGDGRFHVRYEAQGRLGERGIFIFLRRTDRLVVIETFEDGTARVSAKAVKADQRQQIEQSGLTIRGKFRVVTNGTATQGNATSARPREYQNYVIYDWDITSAQSPSPVLYVDLKKPAILPD